MLVLLIFKFIAQRSHLSLTLLISGFIDYETAALTPGDGTIVTKVKPAA